jgi:RIO kinase 1
MLDSLYTEIVLIVRRLFRRCKLVHADLSEYNILYHQEHLYIIDVSQSVEHDHPSAFDFLRNDIKNVEDFFGRLGVRCLGLRRCFEFVTRERLNPGSSESPTPALMGDVDALEEQILLQWLEQREESMDITSIDSAQVAHEDSVFMRSFIPRTLNEVYDPERDVEKLSKGQDNELIYAETIGIVKPTPNLTPKESTAGTLASATARIPDVNVSMAAFDASESGNRGTGDETGSWAGESEEGGSDRESQLQDENGWIEKRPKGHRHEDREAKKVGIKFKNQLASLFFSFVRLYATLFFCALDLRCCRFNKPRSLVRDSPLIHFSRPSSFRLRYQGPP